MSIFERWKMSSESLMKEKTLLAHSFLSTFDLDIHFLPNKKLHILDYPGDENELKHSFDIYAQREGIVDVQITSKLEDEPAASLVFLFLSDPKNLSTKVSYLTTYTSSEHPTIWILVKEKYHPRTKEKIPSIWEPLTNAQYFEIRPTIKIGHEKWIGTRFTIGRQGLSDALQDKDIHMALTLSPQAQQRRSIV